MAVPKTRAYDDVQIAIVCHEMVRGLQLAVNDLVPTEPWQVVGPVVQRLTIRGVERIISGASPIDNHNGWVADMLAAGWRPGPMKDWRAKTHPNLVDWWDLPPVERLKDELFWLVTGRMLLELTP